MLFKISLLLIVAWFLGVFGVYSVDSLHHVLLLVGLLLMLLSFARAREAAMNEAPRKSDDR